jgi:hypothetical protein
VRVAVAVADVVGVADAVDCAVATGVGVRVPVGVGVGVAAPDEVVKSSLGAAPEIHEVV